MSKKTPRTVIQRLAVVDLLDVAHFLLSTGEILVDSTS
jgi:hypothetical protein